MMVSRIEVVGNIAVGKSTLVKSFQEHGYSCAYENYKSVLSLDEFYASEGDFSFETEVAFALEHYARLKTISQKTICDFSLANILAYALTNLKGDALKTYKTVFDYIVENVGLPERIILLSAPIDLLQYRINLRGRESEQRIEKSYLKELNINIKKAVSERFREVEIVTIDTSKHTNYDLNFLQSILKKKI